MLRSLLRELAAGGSTQGTTPRRLHIGGLEAREGWEVLNAVDGPAVTHLGPADDLSQFADGTFAEIYASHVLEHLDFTGELQQALREWHRTLQPGGRLLVSVPDMDVLCRLYLAKGLPLNERYGIMKMIFGGHTDAFDYHKIGFNLALLVHFLEKAGFTNITRVDDLGLFEDTSQLVVHGLQISINVTAHKGQSPAANSARGG